MSAIAERYAAQVAAGKIESDDGQLHAVEKLSRLETELREYHPAEKSGALGWLRLASWSRKRLKTIFCALSV